MTPTRLIALIATALLVAGGALFALASPVAAITNGELDGDDHPEVVLIIVDVNGIPAYRCSGTLIAPTVVVTAGHCVNNFPGDAVTAIRVFTESDVQNGNNTYPVAGGPNSIEARDWDAHPLYVTAPSFFHDVGVVVLEEPIVLARYGALPDVDSLDSLARRRGHNDAWFTAVGYGVQQINPVMVEANLVRMSSTPELVQINVPGFTGDYSLLLSNNHSTGGTCFGDSGGPNFLRGSNVIAGVTSFGLNDTCGGTGGVFRLDRQDVLDFVGAYLP